MSGIKEHHVDEAHAWLTANGHTPTAIAHTDEGRVLAAVALELNVPAMANPATAAVMVDLLAELYVREGMA